MRNEIRALFILLTLLSSITACRKSNIHPDGTTKPAVLEFSNVTLATHKLAAFSVIKNSKYLVVFESGLGGDHNAWDTWGDNHIALKISDSMDVVTYDRGGMGQSEMGPDPRDIHQLQSELNSVINAFANGRKVVLIGHSLGGFIIRDWAIKNPTRVAGLLFVDPSAETFEEAHSTSTQADEDAMYDDWNTNYGANYGATKESRQWVEDLQYMGTLGNLPDVPVIVLTAMKVDGYFTAELRQDWYDAHDLLKNGVTDFTNVALTGSGHLIPIEAPQMLINYTNVLLSKLP